MMKSEIFLFIVVAAASWGPCYMSAQDSIHADDLREFSYAFDLEDGVLTGAGAEILTKAVANAHVVMLGNNSRSQLEFDFDLGLGKVLNQNDYKTLFMEIGPASAGIAEQLTSHPSETVAAFKDLNQNYFFQAGELLLMPIPDLKYEGAATFVQYVKENGWSIGGVGVDSWTGYKLIIDRLYNNLSVANQRAHQSAYQASVDLLDKLYAAMEGQSNDDLLGLTTGIKDSDVFNQFIEVLNTIEINRESIMALRFSIDYWWMYGNRKFYKKNKLSSKRNKVLIKEALDEVDFNFRNDKLFLKMWRGHLTNGVTPNGFYGIGNMLMELAAYHGHSSLNIGILKRYSMEEGALKDVMDNIEQVPAPHQPFLSLGEEDKWILIDLRPFNETFHWGNYIQTLDMHKMMRSYDMIIIPKTDRKAKVNH